MSTCPNHDHHEPLGTLEGDARILLLGDKEQEVDLCVCKFCHVIYWERIGVRERYAKLEEALRTGANTPQPEPQTSEHPACWDIFFETFEEVDADMARDIRERDKAGTAKYGTRLYPFNGRTALVDLYQELLDALVYAVQHMYEVDFNKNFSAGSRRSARQARLVVVTLRAMAQDVRKRIIPPLD